MQDKVIAFHVDETRQVSVAVTDSGKIYARPGVIRHDLHRETLEWTVYEARWQCMGSIFDEVAQGEASRQVGTDTGPASHGA